MRRVLLVAGRDTINRDGVQQALAARGCHCLPTTLAGAVAAWHLHHPDLAVVVASETTTVEALACLRDLSRGNAHADCAFVTATSSEAIAVAAFRAGARHYLREPLSAEALEEILRELGCGVPEDDGEHLLVGGQQLVGRSQVMRQLRTRIRRIAPVSSNVLILGETGTGKELVAELLHLNGSRSARPFVCINTAAIPDALLENELFGHERGAFTGATGGQGGKLVAAHLGTVFLDEIGDISLATQAKLLRAIENKAVYRLGGTKSVHIDVRVIAATNSDLNRATEDGRFRKDLYYRLNVVRVELPPLRERAEDIPLLIGHYLVQFNREFGRSIRGLSTRAMDTLCGYHWPGNIRELRNVIEALLVNLAPETTGVVDVPPEVMRQLTHAVGAPMSERERLLNALAATNWNKTRAAGQLRMSRMTLYRKMQQHSVAGRR